MQVSSKFDTDSKIEKITFGSEDGKGKIMSDWDIEHVEDITIYNKVFSADRVRIETLQVLKDYHTIVIETEHIHKICGISSESECRHGRINSHNKAYEYNNIASNISCIPKEGMAYIKENVTLSSSITLTNDLYLCLNGFNLTGISFVNNSYTVYITNCQEKDNSITVAENTYLANGGYIQILSNKNKIRVNTDKIINADNTVNKPGEFVFMNVDFRQVINGNVDGRIMNVLTANRKLTLSTVSIVNYSIAEGYEMIALVGTNIKTEFYNVTIKGNTTPSRSLMKVGSEGETSRFEGCSFEENNAPNNAIISVRANTKLYMKQNYLYKNMANNLLYLLSADTQVILEDGNEIIENKKQVQMKHHIWYIQQMEEQ